MDVSKMFSRSPEQDKAIATIPQNPIGKQKSPPEIVKEYLELEDEQENQNENIISEVETQILADKNDIAWITVPFQPGRHPLSARFHTLLYEIGQLHDKKQMDYGTADDPFANVRGATEFGLPAPMGAFIAMSDIMSRIKSFVVNGRLENEPLDNALRDMAVYSLIALVLHEEEQQEANGD